MLNERRPRILINCSNLHVGGAVAVATSFIDNLSRQYNDDLDISLLVSSIVYSNIQASKIDLNVFEHCTIHDYYGIRAIWQGLDKYFENRDLVFTVFGPAYFLFKKTRHVFGFAQPHIIYPNNPIEKKMSAMSRLKWRLKYKIQEIFYSRADELVVELEHVKIELEKKYLFRKKPIHIVYSAVDSVFEEPERWLPVEIPITKHALRLGIISRNYPHKNLACLPFLKEYLIDEYQLHVEFFVTFPAQEWDACSDRFKREINNIGSVSLAQCPSFYSLMDGVIFPSLLECFSAVPIEAMMMKRPLFASDLPFIRDCCQEHANYFDPLSINNMADVIANYFLEETEFREENLQRALQFIKKYPGPRERANSYLKIAKNALAEKS